MTVAQREAIEVSDAAWQRPPQAFIDLWDEACGSHGGYNEDTGYFELNGLTDVDYREASRIMSCCGSKLMNIYGEAVSKLAQPLFMQSEIRIFFRQQIFEDFPQIFVSHRVKTWTKA